ncbi:MAG: DUF1761 domain-containing protein [Candidatus Paceibacterota bacterium]
MNNINIWSLIITTLICFSLSSLWYSPYLFGKEWMELRKIGDQDLDWLTKNGLSWRYLAILLSNLVMFSVLAFILTEAGTVSAQEGAFFGSLVWLGFIIPSALSGLVWRREPFKLFLIETIGYLVNLAIGGGILGWWR